MTGLGVWSSWLSCVRRPVGLSAPAAQAARPIDTTAEASGHTGRGRPTAHVQGLAGTEARRRPTQEEHAAAMSSPVPSRPAGTARTSGRDPPTQRARRAARRSLGGAPARAARVIWEFSQEEATSAITVELMALGNHRKSIHAEIARIAEQVRAVQMEAMRSSAAAAALRYPNGELSSSALQFVLSGIPKLLTLEANLGVSTAHAEVVDALERYLDAVEPRVPTRADRVRGAPPIPASPSRSRQPAPPTPSLAAQPRAAWSSPEWRRNSQSSTRGDRISDGGKSPMRGTAVATMTDGARSPRKVRRAR